MSSHPPFYFLQRPSYVQLLGSLITSHLPTSTWNYEWKTSPCSYSLTNHPGTPAAHPVESKNRLCLFKPHLLHSAHPIWPPLHRWGLTETRWLCCLQDLLNVANVAFPSFIHSPPISLLFQSFPSPVSPFSPQMSPGPLSSSNILCFAHCLQFLVSLASITPWQGLRSCTC